MEKLAKAELAFYNPFQSNVAKVKKILKANKKPKLTRAHGLPQLAFDKDCLYLKTCENS
jgi:hypothetical protein